MTLTNSMIDTAPLFTTKDEDNLQLFAVFYRGKKQGYIVVNHNEYPSASSYLAEHKSSFENWDFVRSATQEEFDEVIRHA